MTPEVPHLNAQVVAITALSAVPIVVSMRSNTNVQVATLLVLTNNIFFHNGEIIYGKSSNYIQINA